MHVVLYAAGLVFVPDPESTCTNSQCIWTVVCLILNPGILTPLLVDLSNREAPFRYTGTRTLSTLYLYTKYVLPSTRYVHT